MGAVESFKMSEKADLTLDMGSAPIGKLIWKMSVPSIAGVMAYNVYNLFDTIFVSLLSSLPVSVRDILNAGRRSGICPVPRLWRK